MDLSTGIVDVVFSGRVEAGRIENADAAVTPDRAPGMATMQRSGRVGRDVFFQILEVRLPFPMTCLLWAMETAL